MIDLATPVFGNTLQDYLVFLGALAIGALAGKVVSWLFQNVIKKLAAKTETKLDDVLVDVCDGPLVFAVFIAALVFAWHSLAVSAGMASFFKAIIRIMITLDIAWFVVKFLDSVMEHYLVPYAQKTESDLDDVLLPIGRTVVKAVVFAMAIVMILSDFGFNVSGIIAGLGIGGLAFAFAAKDLIGNIFGGVSIIADKPFKIGDMVKFDNRQGTVKEIGIRTTRIETLDGTTLIVPNAKFTDGVIENVTKRKRHRISIVLGLEYGTSAKKMKEAKEILHKIAKEHKGTADEATVFFSAFNASSIDITFIYFITDLKSIPLVQDEVNMRIKEEFEKAKIEFAYPTQTVIVRK